MLVIVEGPSDDMALGTMLDKVYNTDFVYLHIMHGDITTRKGVTPENIISKIGNEVRGYAKSQHYKAKDFKQIIHIVDTDGVYIPDDRVFGNAGGDRILYKSNGIYAVNPQQIIARNEQKRDNLYRLRSCGAIWNIPYKVYYMSCNMDHVLHDKRNSTDDEKENDAYAFAKRYKNDLKGFVKFICESDFSVDGEYKQSWKYLEDGMKSIERHTNLGLCIMAELSVQNRNGI